MLLREILKRLEKHMPWDLAQGWDNCGLQLGSGQAEIRKAAVCLDPSSASLSMALERGCDLLLSHHPLIFKAQKNIDLDSPLGRLIGQALKAGLNIVSCHTNWDSAAEGVAFALGRQLELSGLEPLEIQARDFHKLVVYVPKGHEEKVLAALFAAGAGRIGDYDHCRFESEGLGGFRVPPDGRPFIGRPGRESRTGEIRLEVAAPVSKMPALSRAVFESHPYEAPAFEFVPVKITGRDQGLGLLGQWDPAREPLGIIREKMGLEFFKWAGPYKSKVSRVALLPGSGGSYVDLAKARGAELLITGDAGYHQAQRAEELGLILADVGHFESEWPGVERLGRLLRESCGLDCEILPQKNFWRYETAKGM